MTIAAIFPGQGSQSVGMLAELAQSYPQVEATFAEASAVLNYDLWQLAQQGSEEQLSQTTVTQPLMLAAGVAVWRICQPLLPQPPQLLAGHSLGEYTALVAAGALTFSDAVAVVAERARLMQEAVPEGVGAMAAIVGLDSAAVVAICAEIATDEVVVSAVNFNSPQQVVVAGHTAAVEAVGLVAKGRKAKKVVLLPVSVPSHSILMRPASEALAATLAAVPLQMPTIPVLHNVSAATTASVEELRSALVAQIYNPVRWVETVERMAAAGITTAVEMGAGKVLVGLNKRIVKTMQGLPVYDAESLAAFQQAVA